MGYFAAASLAKSEQLSPTPSFKDSELYAYLLGLNLDEMSPKDALNALYEVRSQLEEYNE